MRQCSRRTELRFQDLYYPVMTLAVCLIINSHYNKIMDDTIGVFRETVTIVTVNLNDYA